MPNAPRVVAVSCPRLIAAPVERASACNAGHANRFHTRLAGSNENQNAALCQGTLPPHHSVHDKLQTASSTVHNFIYPNYRKNGLLLMPLSFDHQGLRRGLVLD
jgi:hypothetical protein